MAGLPAWSEIIRRGRQPETPETILQAAMQLSSGGQQAEARLALEEVLRRDPRHIRALRELEWLLLRTPEQHLANEIGRRRLAAEGDELFALAWRRLRRGENDAGRDFTEQLAELDANHQGLPCLWALLGDAAPPDALAPELTAQIYDGLATRYDWHSRNEWRRRGPSKTFNAVHKLQQNLEESLIGDIGCGTGLSGEPFATAGASLEGVDLSTGMAERARRRRVEDTTEVLVYDAVEVDDFRNWLPARPARYDIVLAVDSLCHTGALQPVFEAVAAALRPRGLFAFTCMRTEAPTFTFTARGTYLHNPFYVRKALAAAGFQVETSDYVPLEDARADLVNGDVIVARRIAD